MTVLYQDNFTRADSSSWGTASDGNTWSTIVGSSTPFSIVSNVGKAAGTGGTPCINTLGSGSSQTDGEILVKYNYVSSPSTGLLLVWRNNGSTVNGGVTLFMSSTYNAYYWALSGGAFTNVTSSGSAGLTTGNSYWLRARFSGNTLSARVWLVGNAEPGTWTFTASYSGVTSSINSSGYVGLGVYNSTYTNNYTSYSFDNLTLSLATIARSKEYVRAALKTTTIEKDLVSSTIVTKARETFKTRAALNTRARPTFYTKASLSTTARERNQIAGLLRTVGRAKEAVRGVINTVGRSRFNTRYPLQTTARDTFKIIQGYAQRARAVFKVKSVLTTKARASIVVRASQVTRTRAVASVRSPMRSNARGKFSTRVVLATKGVSRFIIAQTFITRMRSVFQIVAAARIFRLVFATIKKVQPSSYSGPITPNSTVISQCTLVDQYNNPVTGLNAATVTVYYPDNTKQVFTLAGATVNYTINGVWQISYNTGIQGNYQEIWNVTSVTGDISQFESTFVVHL